MNSEQTNDSAPVEKDVSAEAEEARAALERENKELSAELEKMKTEQKKKEEEDRAKEHLRRLVGQGGEELYEEVLRRAGETAEFDALPPEKRYEFSYYMLLGEKAERQLFTQAPSPERTPGPRFTHSDGAYHSSVLQTPATFEQAKENAKKYFGSL